MFGLNGLSSRKEQTTEQDCDALISLPILLPCASIISGKKDTGTSIFQGKTPLCQQKSIISKAHPAGNTLSCCITEFSVKKFTKIMWSFSDLHLPKPGLLLGTNQILLPQNQGNLLFMFLPVNSVLVKAQIFFRSFA